MTTPGEARERLSEQAYTTAEPGNPVGLLEEALRLSIQIAPLEKRLRQANREGLIRSEYLGTQIDEAAIAEVITTEEADSLREYHDRIFSLMAVDDFSTDELSRVSAEPKPRKAAKRKQAPRKKVSRKKTASRRKTSSD